MVGLMAGMIILSKLNENEDYDGYKEKIEILRSFIYNKQVYQAQKCQNVIISMNKFFENKK